MAEIQGRQLEFRLVKAEESGTELVVAEQQEPAERGPDGRFLPGNRGARPALTAEQREALEGIRQLAPGVADKMAEMLDSDTVPAASKIRIMEIILERTYGRPEACVKLNAEIRSADASRARLEAIAERIRLEVEG